MVIGSDNSHRRSGASRRDKTGNINKPEFCRSGYDGADRIRRAFRRQNGDVQAFFFKISLAERNVPRRVTAKTDEVENKFHIAFLRLRRRHRKT